MIDPKRRVQASGGWESVEVGDRFPWDFRRSRQRVTITDRCLPAGRSETTQQTLGRKSPDLLPKGAWWP